MTYTSLRRQLVERCAPASVLVGPDGRILDASEGADRFFVSGNGTTASNIFELAPKELRAELRACLESAAASGTPRRSGPVNLRLGDRDRVVIIEARPLPKPDEPGLALVFLHEWPPLEPEAARRGGEVRDGGAAAPGPRTGRRRLEQILDIEGLGAFVFDATGTVIEANDTFLASSGFGYDDIVAGRVTWQTLTPPDYADIGERQFDEARSTGRIGPGEMEILCRDGSRSWMLAIGAGLGDGTFVVFCFDVTDRKQREAELYEKHEQLEAELRAMVRLHDLVGRLLETNDTPTALDEVLSAYLEIVGTDYGTVHIWDREKKVLKLIASRGFDRRSLAPMRNIDLATDRPCTRAVRARRRIIVEDIAREPDLAPNQARARYRSVQSMPLIGRSGAILGVLSTYYPDPHCPTERELRFLDLYARQAADFLEHVRHIEAAELASRRKDEFLATLGHELRNPLAPISMGLELLRSRADDPATIEEARRTMRRQLDQLNALVDDLLDVSRISRGLLTLRFRAVDIRDVVVSAVEEARAAIDNAGHELKIEMPDEPLELQADPHRLAQVLSNLLNNAAKFTPAGGLIRLDARREGGTIALTVADNGIGIDPARTSAIFEIFAMFDYGKNADAHVASGLGIGLTLVKSLTELHGGTVEVESGGSGKGSRFTVRLPAPVQEDLIESDSLTSTGREETAGLKVLVVDDSKASADLLAMVLESLGNEVETAYDGEQAVRAVQSFRPDAVFMDLGMPKMDGLTAARAIRGHESGENVTLIALTGRAQDIDRKLSREAGFDQYLVKPVQAHHLRKALARAGRRSSRKA